MSKGIGLISGGLDSTVVAGVMSSELDVSMFLFIDYGQKTLSRELKAFEGLVSHYSPKAHHVIDMTWLKNISPGSSALFQENVKLDKTNSKLEYVPFRNAVLLSAATACAESYGATSVYIGSTGGDLICPDNSPEFITAYQAMVGEGTLSKDKITIRAPLIDLDKQGVIELGVKLNVPFELSWSCHNNNGELACGVCSNCSARKSSFLKLGKKDPVAYEV